MRFAAFVLTLALFLFSFQVDAASKRLAGGKSVGQQSSQVSKSPVEGSGSVPSAAQSSAARPAPAPMLQPQRSPWGAMLGGMAAGLGLAWLASSLGLGSGMGEILMLILFAMLIMAFVSWMGRRRQAQMAGAGGAWQSPHAPEPRALDSGYKPENVGNDASARPWERSQAAALTAIPDSSSGSMIGSALRGSQAWGVPAGFDTMGFLNAARQNFMTLQAAWDRADIPTLRSMMTDGMLTEIKSQLVERESAGKVVQTATEVDMLQASLLGIEDLGNSYMASVEFSGLIREEVSAGPSPFREVWNLTKPKDGSSGWLVAGVQAMD